MSANLRLVESCAEVRPLWFGGNPEGAAPPAVLSEQRRQQIAAANTAVRALRGLGLRVTGIDYPPAEQRPRVRIERRHDVSLAGLLDVAEERPQWIYAGIEKLGQVRAWGALVCWKELL